MDIRSLQTFLHLCDTLHFGRTSQDRHISTSALSRQIQQMENQLNTTLFERDNRSVKLTKEGEVLKLYAQDSIKRWKTLQQSLKDHTQVLQGEISIYCSVTASYSFLHSVLSDFRSTHPSVAITLRTGDAENAIDYAQKGNYDITIGARPEKLPAKLAFKRMTTSALVVIASAQTTEPSTWERSPLILGEKGLIRGKLDAWFQKKHITPNIYAQVAGHEAIVSMVSLGFGIGVIPKIVLDNSPLAASIQVLPHSPSLSPIDVGLCTQKKRLQNPVIKALWESLSI